MAEPQTGCHFQAEFTTITTAGTRVQLSAADEHISRITFRGDPGNTGNIGVGKSDVSMTSASWTLKPGESITLDFSPKSVLLSDFWVDAATNGDKLNWIVGASEVSTGTNANVTHASTTGQGTDDHHAASHTVASHSDTTATGAETETLTDGSDADGLHAHATNDGLAHAQSHTVASHSDTTATGAELNTLTDGSTTTLHVHSNNAKIATGTYTGDGNATQAVTGVGFAPKFVILSSRLGGAWAAAGEFLMTTTAIVDDDAAGEVQDWGGQTTDQDIIRSLDADGFTVGDGGTAGRPNINATTTNYLAIG